MRLPRPRYTRDELRCSILILCSVAAALLLFLPLRSRADAIDTEPLLNWQPRGDAFLDDYGRLMSEHCRELLHQDLDKWRAVLAEHQLEDMLDDPEVLEARLEALLAAAGEDQARYEAAWTGSSLLGNMSNAVLPEAADARELLERYPKDKRAYELLYNSLSSDLEYAGLDSERLSAEAFETLILAYRRGLADGPMLLPLLDLYGFLSDALIREAERHSYDLEYQDRFIARARREQALARSLLAELGLSREELLREITRLDPQWPLGHFALARVLLDTKRAGEALAELNLGARASRDAELLTFPYSFTLSEAALRCTDLGRLLAALTSTQPGRLTELGQEEWIVDEDLALRLLASLPPGDRPAREAADGVFIAIAARFYRRSEWNSGRTFATEQMPSLYLPGAGPAELALPDPGEAFPALIQAWESACTTSLQVEFMTSLSRGSTAALREQVAFDSGRRLAFVEWQKAFAQEFLSVHGMAAMPSALPGPDTLPLRRLQH